MSHAPCQRESNSVPPAPHVANIEASFALALVLISPDRVIAFIHASSLLLSSPCIPSPLHVIPPPLCLFFFFFLFFSPSFLSSFLPSSSPSLLFPVHGHCASSSFPLSHCSPQFMHGSVNPPSPVPANPHLASMDSANTSQNHGRGPQHSYGATSSSVSSTGLPPLSPQQLSLQQQRKLPAKAKPPRPTRHQLRHSASNGSLSSNSISSSASSVYGSAGPYSPHQQDQLSTQGTKWQTKVRDGQGAVVGFLRRHIPILGWLVLDPGYNWRANLAEDIFAGISKYTRQERERQGQGEYQSDGHPTTSDRGNPVCCLGHSFPLQFFVLFLLTWHGWTGRRRWVALNLLSLLCVVGLCRSRVHSFAGIHEQVPELSPLSISPRITL